MALSPKATFEGTVQPWGNSLGIRITRPICSLAHLARGDKIAINITEDGLVITRKVRTKQIKLPYTESELIEGLTPHKAHSDELPSILDNELEY